MPAAISPGKSPRLNQAKSKKLQAESVVGTYYYMAPEVLQHEKYNAAADWYTLDQADLRLGGPWASFSSNASSVTLPSGPILNVRLRS